MKHTLLAARAPLAPFFGKRPFAACFLPFAACFLLFALSPAALFATHNRAGEIHIRQIGPLTVEATIITWTKASSIPADRDTLNICWGDGTPCQAVKRNNGGGNGVVLAGNIKYNTYVIIHTYAVPARYRISIADVDDAMKIGGVMQCTLTGDDLVCEFPDQRTDGTGCIHGPDDGKPAVAGTG